MARLTFELKDKDGDIVQVHTDEAKLEALLTTYDTAKKLLVEKGFTPIQARSGPGRPPKDKVKFDGLHCPACKSEMWDNRAKNAESGKKGPDFRCKNANCSGSITDKNGNKWPMSLWSGQYEIAQSA